MATWTDPATIGTDPDDPVTSEFGTAALENPEALAEGASGAPRVLYTQGTIGTFTFAYSTSAADSNFGDTVAGSTLLPTSALRRYAAGTTPIIDSFDFAKASALSGTWMCLGYFDYIASAASGGADLYGATLWQRIS